jgi:TonB family protein
MASTEPATRSRSEEQERYYDRHVVPVLVLEINDERSRSRLREAGLLSIIFHLLLIMTVPALLRYSSDKKVRVWTAQELINRQRELTYVEMPKDSQRVTERPKSDIISDKDRIAMSRHPMPDKKTLDELRDSAIRHSAPVAPPSPPAQPQAAQATAPATQPAPRQGQNQMARLEPPSTPANVPNAFARTPLSPGSAIEQAARESAARRGVGLGGGGEIGGGLGGVGHGGGAQGNLEVLSDTMGVDFGPYLARVLHDVRINWYNLIPEVARAPLMKKGKVAIEFAILKDGSVAGMKLDAQSGDVSLDRAAWGGITGSNPFPPLPNEFGGQYLLLRFRFYYNPDRQDLLE